MATNNLSWLCMHVQRLPVCGLTQPMATFCRLWQHLGIMATYGNGCPDVNIWELIATFYNSWQLLATYGKWWQLLATYGTFGDWWQRMVTFGNLWQHLGTYGNFWQMMATFGNLGQLLETYGNIWELISGGTLCLKHIWNIWTIWNCELNVSLIRCLDLTRKDQ